MYVWLGIPILLLLSEYGTKYNVLCCTVPYLLLDDVALNYIEEYITRKITKTRTLNRHHGWDDYNVWILLTYNTSTI